MLAAINDREGDLKRAGDGELRDRARAVRRRAQEGEPAGDLLPECFALVREIARRTLGERPYDEQMLAGIALHQGRLVEMRTGEGKTLAAVAPVTLNALIGRGVHVLTFNDYLARRDAGWMAPLYESFGLTVACVQEGQSVRERQRAYGCDVTYLTVKEAGFDFLRDGLCLDPGGQVHRPLHLALVCGIERLLPAKLRRSLAEESAGGTIDHPAVRREVARVQRIVEGQHGDVRSRLLGFWQLEHQRAELQAWRQEVLEGHAESLPAGRSPRRWSQLSEACGEDLLQEIERRITLITLDRCWSDHLAEMQAVRDEVHLVHLGGRDPFVEYCRAAQAAFEALLSRIDDTIVEIFERIEITAGGVDWEREGLRGPSSTWTYLVNDNVFGNNTFLGLANRASFGLWAVIVCWWILVPWALVLCWRRRREARRAGPEA